MAIQKISKNVPILDEQKTTTFAKGGSKLFNLLPNKLREYINKNSQEALDVTTRLSIQIMYQNMNQTADNERTKNLENMKRTMELMSIGSQRR